MVWAADNAARLPAHPGLIFTPLDGLGWSDGVSRIELATRSNPRDDGQRLVSNAWPRS